MELLAPLGPIRSRRMFGGYGLYADGLFVAIISSDQLYLKTDDQTRPRFEAAGCEPFRYERRGPDGQVMTASLGYFQPPEEALESVVIMTPWARLAMEASLRSANAKPTKTSKAASAKSAKSAKRSAPTPLKTAAPAKTTRPSAKPTPVKQPSGAAAKPTKRKAG